MLQNRVDPFGNLIRTPMRGAWMGNRGVIHNERKEIVRPFKIKPWIICRLQFKGRHRQVMTPNRWTELFFLDEATAFSAGHRPCAECRREDYNRFKQFWLKGNPEYGFDLKTPIAMIDEVMHRERINKDKSKVTYLSTVSQLPDGAFISYQNEPYLIENGKIHHWTPFGYDAAIDLPVSTIEVLTPRSLVNTIAAGYPLQIAINNN